MTSRDRLSEVAAYLIAQFRHVGCAVTTHAFPALDGMYENVIATVPGKHAPSTADHRRPLRYSGAALPARSDNASALAVLLEVARSLCLAPPRRQTRFIAFCLEEEDCSAARAYAASLAGERRRDSRRDRIGMCRLCAHRTWFSTDSTASTDCHSSTGDSLGVIGNEAARYLVTAIMSCGNATVPSLKMIPLTVPGKGELLPDTTERSRRLFGPGTTRRYADGYRQFQKPSLPSTVRYDRDARSRFTLSCTVVPLLVAIHARLAGDS